jgi:VWFA-related protein
MTARHSLLALTLLTMPFALVYAQETPAQPDKAPPQAPTDDNAGPNTDNGTIILKKKKDEPELPPPAPAEPKVKNPNGDTYSLRVDVPVVNVDVSVILDKNHAFVPGLKPANFVVLEDGVEQEVQTARITQTPITAVMLLEFASTSYYVIRDMQTASIGFYNSLKPDDYVAVMTYDMHTHIVTDFTNNKQMVGDAISSLLMPTFRDTNLFDALYETLDRTTRIDGRKYIILIGTGNDTFSKLTLDKIYAKVKTTPNVTIFTIATGGFVASMGGNPLYGAAGGFGGGGLAHMNYLQAQNQLKTFASMTGGLYFQPNFEGELPDIFRQIGDSIRNQYVLTYRPTNNKNDGTYRKIQVLLVDNEGKPLRMQDERGRPLKYSVIARDGYRAKLPVE